jgi:hypothetical protein
MKILVDTGVISSADFLTGDSRIQELKWGNVSAHTRIAGFKRVEPDKDADQQREKDALFTIGRLARQGRITLYTYRELTVEIWRRPRGKEPLLNAFLQCQFQQCPAPIERSKFRTTIDMNEWFAKGGRSDRGKGIPPTEFSQIPFLQWLSNLSDQETATLVLHSKTLRLDDFEVLSLNDLRWFQALTGAFASPENMPDCFHIWTARRNSLDALLILEKKLPRTIEQLRRRKQGSIDTGVAVLRPTELLHQLGVVEIDTVPVDPGRFYSYMEIIQIQDCLLKGQIGSEKLAESAHLNSASPRQ